MTCVNLYILYHIAVLQQQYLLSELCGNVNYHMLELRYEVLPLKHEYAIILHIYVHEKYTSLYVQCLTGNV
jgi:hypothetical protein